MPTSVRSVVMSTKDMVSICGMALRNRKMPVTGTSRTLMPACVVAVSRSRSPGATGRSADSASSSADASDSTIPVWSGSRKEPASNSAASGNVAR